MTLDFTIKSEHTYEMHAFSWAKYKGERTCDFEIVTKFRYITMGTFTVHVINVKILPYARIVEKPLYT